MRTVVTVRTAITGAPSASTSSSLSRWPLVVQQCGASVAAIATNLVLRLLVPASRRAEARPVELGSLQWALDCLSARPNIAHVPAGWCRTGANAVGLPQVQDALCLYCECAPRAV